MNYDILWCQVEAMALCKLSLIYLWPQPRPVALVCENQLHVLAGQGHWSGYPIIAC